MPPSTLHEATPSESILQGPPGPSTSPRGAADVVDVVDVVRTVLASWSDAPATGAGGWVTRLRTTSPLETRFITR